MLDLMSTNKNEEYLGAVLNEFELTARLGGENQLSWITILRKKFLAQNIRLHLERKGSIKNEVNIWQILEKNNEKEQLLLQKYYEMLQENLNKKRNFNLFLRDLIENNEKLIDFLNKKDQQGDEQLVDLTKKSLNTKIEKQQIDNMYLNLKKTNQRYKEIRRRNIYQNFKIKRYTSQKLQLLKRKLNSSFGIPESSEIVLSSFEGKLKYWNTALDFEKKLFKKLNENFKSIIELNLINNTINNTNLNTIGGFALPTNKLTLFANYFNGISSDVTRFENKQTNKKTNINFEFEQKTKIKKIQIKKNKMYFDSINLEKIFENYAKTFINIIQIQKQMGKFLEINNKTNSEILGIIWEFWKTKKRIIELEKLEALYFIKKNLKLNQQNTIWENEQAKAFNKLKILKERFDYTIKKINKSTKSNTLPTTEDTDINLNDLTVNKEIEIILLSKIINLQSIEKQLKILGVDTKNLFNWNCISLIEKNILGNLELVKKLINTPIDTNPILFELLEDLHNKKEYTEVIEKIKPNSWVVDYFDANVDLMNFLNNWESKKGKRRDFWYRHGDANTKDRLRLREAFKAWKHNKFKRKITEISDLFLKDSSFWFEENKNLIDNFRQKTNKKQILDNPRINRNFGSLFRKLNKELMGYGLSTHSTNKKTLLLKNIDDENKKIEELAIKQTKIKENFIKIQNLYKQFQGDKDFDILRFHFNRLRKQESAEQRGREYTHPDRQRKLNLIQKFLIVMNSWKM